MAVFYTITPTHRMVFALGSAVQRELACVLAEENFVHTYLDRFGGTTHLIVELLL